MRSAADGPRRRKTGGRRTTERPIGLGVHQAVEFLLGLFLVSSSVRISPKDGGGPVLGLGIALLVLPAITVGPLAAVRALRPAAHRMVDVVIVMVAIIIPLLPVSLDGNAILLLVLTALALAALTWSTSYTARWQPRPKPAAVTPPPPPTRPPTRARDLGTAAGRGRTQLPRHAGRVVGRLKNGGRK